MVQYITGYHVIEEYLKKGNIKGTLYVVSNKKRPPKIDRLIDAAYASKCSIVELHKQELDDICATIDHRGAVLAVDKKVQANLKKYTVLDEYLKLSNERGLVLLLDGITDPHNFGAILRSADMFGVDLVIYPARRSASLNETVMKTSAGAGAYVDTLEVTNMVRELKKLKKADFWIYGADLKGEALNSITFPKKTGLVLGSEGKGITRLVGSECDTFFSIPTRGHIDSLNVSVAAGIILYTISVAR